MARACKCIKVGRHLVKQLPSAPQGVLPLQGAQKALRLDPSGQDLDVHVAPKVLDHDAAPLGDVLQAQDAGAAGQEVPCVVKGVESCSQAHKLGLGCHAARLMQAEVQAACMRLWG